MKRRYLTSALAAFLLLAIFASSALAQNLRPEDTFYLKPRVGLSDYTGDRDPSSIMNDYGVEGKFPWSLALELGYSFTPGFSVGGFYQIADYPTIMPEIAGDAEWYTRRHTAGLLLRYTFGASNWRIAPFLETGFSGSVGYTEPGEEGGSFKDPISYGPILGAGLDIALNDRTSFFIEAQSNWHVSDRIIDGATGPGAVGASGHDWRPEGVAEGVEIEDPGDDEDVFSGIDALTAIGIGLKVNLRSAFTAVDVMSLDCPAEPLQVGQTATFTAMTNDARATPPVNYRWDFGTAGQAQGLVVTRSFDQAGTYTVSFTAENDRSSETMTCTVVVEEPPVAAEIVSISADPMQFEVCEPQTVSFSANVRGDEPVEYSWSFGDGSTGRGPNPTHVYETPGTYTVTLEVSNETGTDTRSMTITAEECEPEICQQITEMNPVFFGRNSSTLTAEARAALRENLELFSECPNLCARIEGYAAPGERNAQELSEDRARAVEQFYVDNGIAASRFETIGRGQVEGVTSKKEGASQYRRVTTTPMQCDDM